LAGLSEEFGWVGYALPLLQESYSGIYSAIILGVIWGFWSVPLFFYTWYYTIADTFLGFYDTYDMCLYNICMGL